MWISAWGMRGSCVGGTWEGKMLWEVRGRVKGMGGACELREWVIKCLGGTWELIGGG